MEYSDYKEIRYCIFDPTGNITALVETPVDVSEQPRIAERIMKAEPNVEQVGFVVFSCDHESDEVPVSLRMAGGEFCGNAAMCAAALFAIRSGLHDEAAVRVAVSGASEPVEVALGRRTSTEFNAAASMPPALSISTVELTDGSAGGGEASGADGISVGLTLPVVKMEGISHIIIEQDSGLFGLKDDQATAERLLRSWCGALGADCLGLMFVSARRGGEAQTAAASDDAGIVSERALTPLVYVPGADTMFWENSCASGTAAAGMYLASKAGFPVDITFTEPSGRLRVQSDPATGRTVLNGSAALLTQSDL